MSGSGQGIPAPGSGNSNAAGMAGADPSMEDILASIRRILSEDETPAATKLVSLPPEDDVLALDESMLVQEPLMPAPASPVVVPFPPPVALPDASPLAALASFMPTSLPPSNEPPPANAAEALFQPPMPQPMTVLPSFNVYEPQIADPPPERPVFLQGSIDALSGIAPSAPVSPAFVAQPPPPIEAEPPVAVTLDPPVPDAAPPARTIESLVAPEAAAAASASMSSLVRTLAAERHSTVYRGGPTLEDMVRDEMRPMLKDWLDNNLPAMVERIVRSEIERVAGRVTL